ncbi:hypothetical protein ACIBD9_17895 [Micromonospora sp. NPDC050784]|uniref:hypothetical protein n=1 Tax=Micromonospora sp. NPDC050784 TaxID=3364281 RepID=UPI00378F3567
MPAVRRSWPNACSITWSRKQRLSTGIVVHGILSSGSPTGALLAGSAKAALILVAADARIRYGGLLAGPGSVGPESARQIGLY